MPRPKKPARLCLRRDNDGQKRWVIKDGPVYQRTGCAAHEIEKAEQALDEYRAGKYQPDTSKRHSDHVRIADVLMVYLDAREGVVARPDELRSRVGRLNDFWGDKTASQIKGRTCRTYVTERGKLSAARRELEDLRAACAMYKREYGLSVEPSFTLPDKSQARERWMTRQEAARLLWAAYKSREVQNGKETRRYPYRHLARFILIGLYTGTRHDAILKLRWLPNTQGGWIDLEEGVMHRRGETQRETKKRRPPAKLPPRLLAHLRRWHEKEKRLSHVVHRSGKKLARINKGWHGARRAAGLDVTVTPHIMRHTRATWLMQSGVGLAEAAQSLGMTIQQLEATYWHHHPDFQKGAANAY